MKEKHNIRRRRRRPRRPVLPIILALLIGLVVGLATSVDVTSIVEGDGDSEINIYFGLVNIIGNDESVDTSERDERVLNIITVDESDNSPVNVEINSE